MLKSLHSLLKYLQSVPKELWKDPRGPNSTHHTQDYTVWDVVSEEEICFFIQGFSN